MLFLKSFFGDFSKLFLCVRDGSAESSGWGEVPGGDSESAWGSMPAGRDKKGAL